ncbi:hypothetical protein DESC_120102 [Desulfosarcina cetonica]|nr:hypothetical protein DESC_120102 [Desulfosarcina cetonica]
MFHKNSAWPLASAFRSPGLAVAQDHAHGDQLLAQAVGQGPVLFPPGLFPLGDQVLNRRIAGRIFEIENIEHGIDASQGLEHLLRASGIDLFVQHQGIDALDDDEQRGQGGGDVQIIVHGRGEAALDVVAQLIQFSVGFSAAEVLERTNAGIQACQGLACPVDARLRKHHRLAIVHRQKPVADRAAVEAHVQEGLHGQTLAFLIDFFAVHQDPIAMHPVTGQALAGQCAGNGDLVLVVRKNQLPAGAVDIIIVAQMAHGHGRALQVPGGAHVAPVGLGVDAALEFRQARAFEQGEIAGVVLFVLFQVHGGANADFVDIHARQLAVRLVAGNIEIDRAQFLVGIALLDQPFGQVHHVVHMLAGLGVMIGRLDAQDGQILVKGLDVHVGESFEGHPRGLGSVNGLVVQVGDVHHLIDRVSPVGQVTGQQIGKDEAPRLAHLQAGMGRGAAGVHGHLARVGRQEGLFLARHGVEEHQVDLLLHVKQRRGEVALPTVGKDHHQGPARKAAGDIGRHHHGRPTAHTHHEPLLAGQAAGHGKGRLIFHVDLRIELFLVENLGLIGLLHVFQPLQAVPQIGLHTDDLDGRIVFLQPPGKAHEGSRGTHGGHQVGQGAAGLLPDLHRRSKVVGLPVGRIVVLIGHEIGVGIFAGQAVDLLDGAVGTQVAGREQNIGPACAQDLLAFDAGRLAHGQQQRVALDRTDHRQADAGIAAGGLDNGLAGFEFSRTLAGFDHRQGRPVLDRAAGIEVLQFCQDAHLRVGIEVADFHQGGVADVIKNAVAHHRKVSL